MPKTNRMQEKITHAGLKVTARTRKYTCGPKITGAHLKVPAHAKKSTRMHPKVHVCAQKYTPHPKVPVLPKVSAPIQKYLCVPKGICACPKVSLSAKKYPCAQKNLHAPKSTPAHTKKHVRSKLPAPTQKYPRLSKSIRMRPTVPKSIHACKKYQQLPKSTRVC